VIRSSMRCWEAEPGKAVPSPTGLSYVGRATAALALFALSRPAGAATTIAADAPVVTKTVKNAFLVQPWRPRGAVASEDDSRSVRSRVGGTSNARMATFASRGVTRGWPNRESVQGWLAVKQEVRPRRSSNEHQLTARYPHTPPGQPASHGTGPLAIGGRPAPRRRAQNRSSCLVCRTRT
jgi:hypothetical protein